MIAHQYPLIENIETIEEIRMVSLLDIGAMKLNAIFQSGKRLKDFVDMYFLLETYTLDQLLGACQKKYTDINTNMVKQSLIHHDDIINLPVEFIGAKIKWPVIADRLKEAFHNHHITYGPPDTTKKLMENLKADNKKKGRGRRP